MTHCNVMNLGLFQHGIPTGLVNEKEERIKRQELKSEKIAKFWQAL